MEQEPTKHFTTVNHASSSKEARTWPSCKAQFQAECLAPFLLLLPLLVTVIYMESPSTDSNPTGMTCCGSSDIDGSESDGDLSTGVVL
jgi:hypothetical protein